MLARFLDIRAQAHGPSFVDHRLICGSRFDCDQKGNELRTGRMYGVARVATKLIRLFELLGR